MFTSDEQAFIDTILVKVNNKTPKIAFHSPCPDGMSMTALYLYTHPDQDFILLPFDYWFLKVKQIRSILATQAYHAIFDLEPFNETSILELYVDHHRSTIGKPIKANQIIFDANGESATAVFFDHVKYPFPSYLEELVDITRITDTASFTLDAPTSKIPLNTHYTDWYQSLSLEEKAWLLEDLARSIFSYDEIIQAVHALKDHGVMGLLIPEFITKINSSREVRSESLQVSKTIKPTDMMVLIFTPKTYDHKAIMADLMKRGVKVIVSLTQDADGGFRMSLRLSKLVQKTQSPEAYRLDLLAKHFNGGGHPAAAGGKLTDYDRGLERLRLYAKEHDLQFTVIDLRKRAD